MLSNISGHFPLGIIIQGVVLGALNSLVSLGLVLIYRSSKVINFSQSAIGGLAGSFAIVATQGWGFNYYLSVAIGLVVAILSGAIVELSVIERLRNSPRLIVTVATLGVFQIFGAFEIGLPHLVKSLNTSKNLEVPLKASFSVGSIPISSAYVLIMVCVPIVLVLLYLFLYKTRWGVSLRATGDSPERATLLGISVRRVSLITWTVAALISGIYSILADPIISPSVGNATTPQELLIPLAAVTLAGFESLGFAVFWSVLLGLFEQLLYWNYPSTNTLNLILFIVIAVGLLLKKGRSFRMSNEPLGDYVAIRAVRPLPEELQRNKQVKAFKVISSLLLFIGVLVIPVFLNSSAQLLLSFVAIYAIVAISLVVITGWAGQVSLGQFGFVGIGSMACATLLVRFHADLFVSLLACALFGAVVSAIIGIPALRLPGLSLAVVTFGFAIVVSTWLLSGGSFPYLNPTNVARPLLFGKINLFSNLSFYEFCVVVLVLCLLMVTAFSKSRAARVIKATRDNPNLASVYAISPFFSKMSAFSISGAFAGLAGGLYVLALGGIGFTGINPNLSIVVFTMVVVGGLGSIMGALLGAAYVELVSYFLPPGWELFASGAGLLILLLVLPEGLGGLAYKLRDQLIKYMKIRTSDLEQRALVSLKGPIQADQVHSSALRLGALEEIESRVAPTGALKPEAASQDPLLFLSNADSGYEGNQILFNVSLIVEKNEILALLGTNGSGKSTILRVIAGLNPLERGKVFFKSKDISKMPAQKRVKLGIVTVFGGKAVFPSLTVFENLYLAEVFSTNSDGRYDRQRIFELFPNLRERLKLRAELLSGGERQMLGIAQAILLNPELLLIDELSLGLSPIIVNNLTNVITQICTDRSAIVVEQSVNVAAAISKKAIFLERGKVRFSGPTPDLNDQPKLMRSVFLNAAKKYLASSQPKDELASERDSKVLTVKHLSLYYDTIVAVHDMSIDLREKEIMGIIGPNGAGKTSFLHLISGLLRPSSGEIILRDFRKKGPLKRVKNVTNLSAVRRAQMGLATMFQNAPLYHSMTVFETISVSLERQIKLKDPFLSLFSVPAVRSVENEIKVKASGIISLLGLDRFRNKYIFELSTGTRRIVEIGCILAHDPKLILLDEPSSGIAQRETEALRDILIGLRDATGASLIIVEHDVPLVSTVSDTLVCFNLGEIVAKGRPDEVLSDPIVIESYLGLNV